MKTCIIISRFMADQNIKKFLTDLPENIFIYETDKTCLECDNIDKEVEADLYVFATKHQSKVGTASLTCHSPGNWGEVRGGGKEKKLCVAPALYLKQFYLALKKYNVETEVTLEVTHHGPYLEKPCMFVEIGSSEKQWTDEKYGKIIADCIKKVFSKNYKGKSAILLGGGHYNSSGNKIIERTDYAIGHICPKYALKDLDENMLEQAMNKTVPYPEIILLDWKGLGKEKQRIKKMLENKKHERVQRLIKH